MLLLVCFVADVKGSCSSSASCPLHASDSIYTCWIKSISQFWNFAGSKFAFPGKGLYTLAKISKDTSNCCYDLEVQAFMCEVLRGGVPVSICPHRE